VSVSPLLVQGVPLTVVHFQFEPSGQLSSPQAPAGPSLQRALEAGVAPRRVQQAEANLARLAQATSFAALARQLPAPRDVPLLALQNPTLLSAPPQVSQAVEPRAQQQARNQSELNVRRQYVAQNTANYFLNEAVVGGLAANDAQGAAMTPLWQKGQLLLARRVRLEGAEVAQGCWLDWPAIQRQLLASVADLLPGARLRPSQAAASEQPHLLASLPIELVPGTAPAAPAAAWSPLGWALVLAWLSLGLAGAAVGLLLWGVMSLSERRGAFVSAVTHELRTPLTTFRLYAEMLAEGLVREPDRQGYLQTLRAEADRLGHLVENVLAFARLERAPRVPLAAVPLSSLLSDESIRRSAERSAEAGFELLVELGPGAEAQCVAARPAVVEQILFNLVDNAGKYAASARDRRLHLRAEVLPRLACITVEDHGPGVPQGERRRLFQPFHKSAGQAAEAGPGVGLGLAICRRLARDLGGDLRLEPGAHGARFVLRLRLARPA
jgi:signal transduction histidine kinase